MFVFDPAKSAITMHRGDTGAYFATFSRSSGEPFSDGDVALYTVKKADGTVMIDRVYDLYGSDYGNGKVLVMFRNSDTDTWEAGTYTTEMRVIINPIVSGGKYVDGDTVRTIVDSISTLTIVDVQKEV